MNNVYLISDTHFGHNKMVEYCGRPENHSELLMENLLAIPSTAVLIHLGDLCFGQQAMYNSFIQVLPYKKILVKGNHDTKSITHYMNHGWDFCCNKFQWNIGPTSFVFTHEPIKIEGNEINIHGHLHNNLSDEEHILTPRHLLFACENTNYKPVLLEKFINGRV